MRIRNVLILPVLGALRWTPVTVYEFNGRYYPHNGPGGRAGSMYRYQDEYALPPQDQVRVNFHRRFIYQHQPTADDHGRGRRLRTRTAE